MKCAPLSDDLLLTCDGQTVPAPPSAASPSLASPRSADESVDLRTILREDLASLDASAREEIVDRLASATSAHPNRLRHDLHRVREALRERLPTQDDVRGGGGGGGATRGLHVDGLLRIDANSFYLHGWAIDRESDLASLAAWTPEGETLELLGRAFRFPHADADGFYSGTYRERASGFACFFHTRRADPLPDGWLVVSRNAESVGLEARAPTLLDDTAVAREVVLSHLRHDRDEKLIRDHAHPAMDAIGRQLTGAAQASDVREFGAVPRSPAVSLVIPLFDRIDLVEHQLARLAQETQAREVEILYVLDSPQLAAELRDRAAGLVDLFGLPLRCVTMKESSGQAGATNVGVKLARGRRVVLMHSDVVPIAAGWIGEMSGFLDANPTAAAVGATLVYHDESIQHAGYEIAGGEIRQPAKGLHADRFAPGEPKGVDAVSTACMMIDRERFLAAGGMAGRFAAGGPYEDADLAARLTTADGRNIFLLPRTRLYHLEGQSRSKRLRELATPYDAWLFNQLWQVHTGSSR